MSPPLIFHLAFFLGINWSSRIGLFKTFLICGLIVSIFVLPVILFQLFADMEMLTGVIFAVSFFRSLITWSFVVMGVVRCKSDDRFFEKVLSEVETGLTLTGHDGFINLHFLILVGFAFPQEVVVASYGSVSWFFIRLITSFLILTVPLVFIMLFVFCCLRVYDSYAKLQEKISKISSHPTVNGLSKIKLTHISINECVEGMNNEFGMKLFLTTLVIQTVLLEKLDRVIFLTVSSNDFGDEAKAVAIAFVGFLATLGYLSYYPWKIAQKVRTIVF